MLYRVLSPLGGKIQAKRGAIVPIDDPKVATKLSAAVSPVFTAPLSALDAWSEIDLSDRGIVTVADFVRHDALSLSGWTGQDVSTIQDWQRKLKQAMEG